MTYEQAIAYIAKRKPGSTVLGSAGQRARRPHWHPHSYIFFDNKLVHRGIGSMHRPYWPLEDHTRMSGYVASLEDKGADDWLMYREPEVGSDAYDTAYKAAKAKQAKGFK